MKKNEYPEDWTASEVRELAGHYDSQTDEEAAAEHEAALSRPDHTLIPIPRELVPRVHRLIAQHQAKRAT